jgi:RimJ/RimL family protein N-acetyltransferase
VIPRELRTARLLLRQWREGDAEALAEIYAQPEFLEHNPARDAAAHVERFARQWELEGFSLWAVEDLGSGSFIGRIGLMRHHDWPVSPDPVEVGWVLHRDWWGRGLATEGGLASLCCWRKHLADPQLISITLPTNGRSRGVMERLGLTLYGEAHWHGHDVVWYAVER